MPAHSVPHLMPQDHGMREQMPSNPVMINYKDPKYRLSASTLGRRPFAGERNHSAVLSQKTAASSNHLFTQQGFVGSNAQYQPPSSGNRPMMPQYSTAVIGGGGPNIYDRLLNDSTENLLRPTA